MGAVEEQELLEREEAERLERDAGAAGDNDLEGGDRDPFEGDLPVTLDDDDDLEVESQLGDEQQRQLDQEHQRESEALMEERGKKLDKVGAYVAKKLVEIFGEEAADELELCELCQWTHTYGWRVSQTPPPAVRDAVKRAIGLGTIDEMLAYAAFTTCDTCDGLGNVKTGSQVTEYLYRTCPTCGGRGYSSTLEADAGAAPVRPIVAAMPAADGAPPQAPDLDMFGTPRGHPDYGKLAQHREVPISHWADNLPQS